MRGPVAGSERVFDTGAVVVPAELRQVADRARPVTLARERTLPVAEPLQALLPDGALARGSAVAVAGAGATSLALNLAAGLLARPAPGWWSWAWPNWAWPPRPRPASTCGGSPSSTAPEPGRWAAVVAALVGGVDVIVVDGRGPAHPVGGSPAGLPGPRAGLGARRRSPPGRWAPSRRPGAWPADVTLSVAGGPLGGAR